MGSTMASFLKEAYDNRRASLLRSTCCHQKSLSLILSPQLCVPDRHFSLALQASFASPVPRLSFSFQQLLPPFLVQHVLLQASVSRATNAFVLHVCFQTPSAFQTSSQPLCGPSLHVGRSPDDLQTSSSVLSLNLLSSIQSFVVLHFASSCARLPRKVFRSEGCNRRGHL